jgi:hypothetical protein
MMKNYSLNRLLVLFVTLGFAFLMADSILEHWPIFLQEPWAFVPVIFSAVGAIIGVMTVVRWNERWIRLMHVTLLAAFLVSAGGFYFHAGEEDESEKTAEVRDHEQKEKDKPLLAPFAFGGLAVAGLLGTSRKWHAEVRDRKSVV